MSTFHNHLAKLNSLLARYHPTLSCSYIRIYYKHKRYRKIYTDCSRYVYKGQQYGHFKVVKGKSTKGGFGYCPPCRECPDDKKSYVYHYRFRYLSRKPAHVRVWAPGHGTVW
eukprot:274997_1